MEATELEEIATQQLEKAKEISHRIEKRAQKIPPEAFLAFGLAACTGATLLSLAGKHRAATMLAAWVPTALALGLYVKIGAMHQYEQTLPELPGE